MTKAREISATPETVISSGTFSAVTSVSISNALSDTYKFYTLYIRGSVTTSAQLICLRFRENTTDRASGYYGAGFYTMYQGSTGSYYAKNNGTEMILGEFYTDADNQATVTATITRPHARNALVTGVGYDVSNSRAIYYGYNTSGMTNFNGITFYVGGQTMSGSYVLTGIR
jgi:hypothetical protein